RLWFETVELWAEGAHRFHERLRYRRNLERADAHTYRSGAWSAERLQPCPHVHFADPARNRHLPLLRAEYRDYGRPLGGRPDLRRGLLRLLQADGDLFPDRRRGAHRDRSQRGDRSLSWSARAVARVAVALAACLPLAASAGETAIADLSQGTNMTVALAPNLGTLVVGLVDQLWR